MTTVTRQYQWAMGHRLQRHEGLCRHMHGHTYSAEVTITGSVRQNTGMVLDFHDLDAMMKELIEKWDHAFMIEDTDKLGPVLLEFDPDLKLVSVGFPPTAENIASALLRRVQARLERRSTEGLECHRVRVDEGPRSWAEVAG